MAIADTFIAKLLAYAERVCQAVLGPDASSPVSVSAYGAADCLPAHIAATHEFMIVIDFSSLPGIMPEASQRLSSFLGKRIFFREENASAYLYWGEGEPLDQALVEPTPTRAQPLAETNDSPSLLKCIEWLKTDTILPNWLDCILFDSLGARYEPDWQRFEHNLDLNEDEVKVYLGTYFPRSYAEAFCILDDLLDNAAYNAAWRNKKDISILDVGTGTGGNLVGLLSALGKHCPNIKTVTVHGYDGNKLAIDAARFILESFASRAPFTMDISLIAQRITSLAELPLPRRETYDFITTFKMGGEIISTGGGLSDDFYHQFLTLYARCLSDIGLQILLDVTIKPDHTEFFPQLLNEQVSRFIRGQTVFVTLVPVPCHLYEVRCSESCFTQKEFNITHREARNDRSRVAYRIIARNSCAKLFHITTPTFAEYVICAKATTQKLNTCMHSAGRGILLDGYKINAK